MCCARATVVVAELLERAGELVRIRVFVLCAGVVVVGSPWIQHPLLTTYSGNALLRWAQSILSTPQWRPLTEAVRDFGAAITWSDLLCVATLLVGIVVLVPRVVLRAPAGRVRQATAFGTGVAIGAVAGLLSWIVLAGFAHGLEPADQLFVNLEFSSAAFGALLGLAMALIFAEGRSPASPAARSRRRPIERRNVISTLDDSSPTALGRAPGDVTRYLCAAAYTDPGFARRVVEKVLGDPFGAVAASPGVDLVPVVRHALAARDWHQRRDLRLSAVFCAILVLAPLWLPLGAMFLNIIRAAASPGADPKGAGDRGHSRSKDPAAVWRGAAAFVVLLTFGVLIGNEFSSLPIGVAQWLFGGYLYGIPVLLTVGGGLPLAYAIVVNHQLATDALLRDKLRRERFTPDAAPEPKAAPAWLAERLEAITRAQRGNVTVYSGWLPHQGFAARQSNWSVALPVVAATNPAGTGPAQMTGFDAWDLVSRLRESLHDLAGPAGSVAEGGGTDLTGLLVEDRVFVHGATIGGDNRFLTDDRLAPVSRLDQAEVRLIALNPTSTARHCLGAFLPLWGGDVVPGVLLHVSVSEQTVHVECDVHTLPPVRGSYHAVDVLPDVLTPERRLELLLTSLPTTGPLLRSSAFNAVSQARFETRRAKRELRELRAIEQDPQFDYGAGMSVREEAMNPTYLNYFQVLDGQRVTKALTRHTLNAIREFLDAHGVDTTDFQRQQQTILNHGVIQQGGTSVIGNQAVGQGANATQFNQPPTQQAPTTP